jgi:predicted nuclease of predicted toxin-antitoxin system
VRFLADENFPRPSTQILAASGHDVVAIRRRLPSVTDSEVAERASTEDRILLTFDSDFGDIIYHRGMARPPSVVYFRLHPQSPTEPARLLAEILDTRALELVGLFTIVEVGSVRQRQLPESP